MHERVQSLASALERAHREAEKREAQLRRIADNGPVENNRNNQHLVSPSNAFTVGSESEHKALQEFM